MTHGKQVPHRALEKHAALDSRSRSQGLVKANRSRTRAFRLFGLAMSRDQSL
jgi:hypothetical protein